MPIRQGTIIKILDQVFYVVDAGAKPETVKLYGPFMPNRPLSVRTVNWEKFLKERIRII
jgi:hypothetical protein